VTFFLTGKLFNGLGVVMRPLNKISVRLVVLPLFGQYLFWKQKLGQKTSSLFEQILLFVANKRIVHILIIVIAVLVTTSNIMAYETTEEYGRGAIIYELAGMEDLDTIEDTATFNTETQVYSYLGESSVVTSETFTEAQKREENIQQQQDSDLVTTQGGSALVKPGLASTEAAMITRTTVKEHTVNSGDTIGDIAQQFSVSVNTLLWANNLSFYSFIKPGQRLIIPPTSGVLHTIARGDTLSKVASKYQANISTIKRFNNIDSDDSLTVGETIMVPGGRIVYTTRPRSIISTPVSAPAYTTPTIASGGKMYWPSDCRRITQYYLGWRLTGLDIACGFGRPIRVAEAGTVSKVLYNRYGYGYHVIVDHGGGRQTLYGHLSRIYVKVGQKVSKAEVIAAEGSTGQSTGSHLHFEVRINGSRLNPLNYVR